jgi:prepilin-type N-terminal cleavage/methylation domain-containing protein
MKAFTLLELLVSMAILAVLIVLLMSIMDGATKLWRQSENRVDSYREARAAVNAISGDLDSMLISTNMNFFSLDRSDKLPSTIRPPSEASNIFFLSAQQKGAQEHGPSPENPKNNSDLCVVGYFLALDKIATGSPAKSFNLYRYFLCSDDSFKAIQANTLLGDTLSTSPTAGAPAGAEVLARNIIDFRLRSFSVDDQGEIKKFEQSVKTPLPDFVEIELTALNNESTKRFKSYSDWLNKNSPTYKENARTFRTRVHLHADTVKQVDPTPTPTPSA